MITVKQLSFGYTRRRNIFDSLSLELPKGSIVGLLGRNGEGKTTLLKLLYGQLLRRQGELKVLDSDPKHRAVSFLQQGYLRAQSAASSIYLLPSTLTTMRP